MPVDPAIERAVGDARRPAEADRRRDLKEILGRSLGL
jgi:hypothetical protein